MLRLGLWLCLAASASASVSRVKRIVRHGGEVAGAGGKGGGLRQSKKAGENFFFGKNLQKLIQQQVRTIIHFIRDEETQTILYFLE